VKNYGKDTKALKKENYSNQRRKKKGKMEQYLECLEKNDGSEKLIKF